MFFFFFNDTATTEIYTLSLHDALPISRSVLSIVIMSSPATYSGSRYLTRAMQPNRFPKRLRPQPLRSEEHTSELQSQSNLVCRLLLEKKKKTTILCHIRHT